MTETKHTPGPWRVYYRKPYVRVIRDRQGTGDPVGSVQICHIAGPESADLWEFNHLRWKADAELIADACNARAAIAQHTGPSPRHAGQGERRPGPRAEAGMSASPQDVIADTLLAEGCGDGEQCDKTTARILAALRAAGYVVERDWQDISTAPRDGTWIWCWHEEKRWRRVGMRSKASGPRWYYSSTGVNAQYADDTPTHWRPLPAPPDAV